MAYRRRLTARANHLYQQRFGPSFSCIHRDDNDCKNPSNNPIWENPKIPNFFQQGFLGTRNSSFCRVNGSKSLFRDYRFSIPVSYGPVFARYMSAASVGEGAADKIEIVNDVVEVLADKTAEAGAVVNEVAIAAADSYFPVAALQYLIDYVHSITGFNWWASIIATTLVIRWLALPLMVNQLKATSKFTLLRPQLEEIKEDMQNRGMTPTAVAEGQAQMQALFKEYGVTPFTPLKGLLIQGPVFVSFFLAISNMVEKVPSFKHGGAFWFTDLTTPDSMYIFPVLTALTFWITVEEECSCFIFTAYIKKSQVWMLLVERAKSVQRTRRFGRKPIRWHHQECFKGLCSPVNSIYCRFSQGCILLLDYLQLFLPGLWTHN
ncbi:mitochondrial inner membrane protein OXA1-like isoform X3 [Olea europaea var. sylvestris]|uniref:mitochondrial inner membrane protein OXA1-like isoform X3 n=1 Tax=Olea europaea var. sylvestris TaxID=158386 RepID=UPI000C1CDCAD|nr:mitochondrial inner membrane protein OXA1-like isoform X3 [Olea europaea var. sylvestris]